MLKHSRLEPGTGLWIAPCEAVHSFGMKFAIDLVYLDRKKRVRKIRREMVPRRLSTCCTTGQSLLLLLLGVFGIPALLAVFGILAKYLASKYISGWFAVRLAVIPLAVIFLFVVGTGWLVGTRNSVLELPVGAIDASRTEPGDQLDFEKLE